MKGTILVFGATGHQGGGVVRHLMDAGWPVRALVRNPDSPEAQDLQRMGIEVVKGDMEDRRSLDAAMEGVYGVFSVQNFWEAGYEDEIKQGKNVADAAKAAGVQHFVYSSVGGAERNTGISHFESKWIIEEHVRSLDLPWTIFRPVFFMDNFSTFLDQIKEGKLVWAQRTDRPLQMIASDDIGAFVAMAFDKPEEFKGTALEIAGDKKTMLQVAEAFSQITGKSIEYKEISTDEVRSYSPEYAVMIDWFNRAGYEADIPALRKMYPGLKTLEDWLRQTSWIRDKLAVG